MEDYTLNLSLIAGISIVSIPIWTKMLYDGIQTGLKAKLAFDLIATGDNPVKYRWDIDDARIDSISRFITGGKRLDQLSFDIEKEIDSRLLLTS